MSRIHRILATLFSVLIVFPLLSGCSLIFGQGGPSGSDAVDEESGLTSEEREAMVNESKINRYVARIVDDPVSLSVFVNQMPKGADVRVIPSAPDAASPALSPDESPPADGTDVTQSTDTSDNANTSENASSSESDSSTEETAAEDAASLPFPESEYRAILTRALAQRIGYLEIVASITPEQIRKLDGIQGQVTQEFSERTSGFKVRINFLAPIDGDLAGEDFKNALSAAVDCFDASDRVVGIILLPATTDEGKAAFHEQMNAIDFLDQSLRDPSVAPEEATDESAAASPDESSADESAASPTESSENEEAASPTESPEDKEKLSSADSSADSSEDQNAGQEDEGTETEDEGTEPEEERFLPPLSITIDDAFITNRGFVALSDSISAALDLGHATRIDFGASIAYETNAYELLKRLVDKGIGVTVTPRSIEGLNDSLTSDTGTYRLFASAGVKIAVTTNSDPEGRGGQGAAFQGNLGVAFTQLASAHALTYSDLKALAYSALDAAFLTDEQRDEQRESLDAAFKMFEATISQTIDDFQLLR